VRPSNKYDGHPRRDRLQLERRDPQRARLLDHELPERHPRSRLLARAEFHAQPIAVTDRDQLEPARLPPERHRA